MAVSNCTRNSETARQTDKKSSVEFLCFFVFAPALRLALCLVGARVLGGWEPLPWGHTGPGPVPATLEAIIVTGVSSDALEHVADAYFKIDGTSPPTLNVGGALRHAVSAALATSIMYYGERVAAGEMPTLHGKLRAVVLKYKVAEGNDAHGTLVRWGGLLRAQFDLDNLKLTTVAAGAYTRPLFSST